MGNWCPKLIRSKQKPQQKRIVLLLVGLDNAGKTVAVKGLAGESRSDVMPTVGFSAVTLDHEGHTVLIYDLGGGEQIRGIWHRYFIDVHGIIFVIDSSDSQRLEECEFVLDDLLSHENLNGKPLLILANKQDLQGALDEIDIVEQLHIERIVNKYQCPTMVETCSANSSSEVDTNILNGYNWLITFIVTNYDVLNSRVEADLREQKIQDEKARQAKKLRSDIQKTADQNKTDNNRPTCMRSFFYNTSLTKIPPLNLDVLQRPATCPSRSANSSVPPGNCSRRPMSALERVRDQLEICPSPRPKKSKRVSVFSFLPNNKVGVL